MKPVGRELLRMIEILFSFSYKNFDAPFICAYIFSMKIDFDPIKNERNLQERQKPLISVDGEVRELTSADMAKFKPAAEMLSPSLRKKLGVRGPQKTPTKERITIRLSREVLEQFRESGAG